MVAVIYQLGRNLPENRPYPELHSICYANNQWKLVLGNEEQQDFLHCNILLHNFLFQLIRFSNPKKNKIIILFNDQIPKQQLRYLHLKERETSI